jgi:hypothetical protein
MGVFFTIPKTKKKRSFGLFSNRNGNLNEEIEPVSNIIVGHRLSPPVTTCHHLSPPVATCHQMSSLWATTCHHLS